MGVSESFEDQDAHSDELTEMSAIINGTNKDRDRAGLFVPSIKGFTAEFSALLRRDHF